MQQLYIADSPLDIPLEPHLLSRFSIFAYSKYVKSRNRPRFCMNITWEQKFRHWAAPPSQTEQDRCNNAIQAIRNAINSSKELRSCTRVFSQGPYRDNTNARRQSDVDIGALYTGNTFFADYPDSMNSGDFYNSSSGFTSPEFSEQVEQALRSYFSGAKITRGNKAVDLKSNSYRVEADIAAFFEHRRYSSSGGYISGVELRPDNDLTKRVINWPEQHYQNGVEKNEKTARRYKALVRILKNLRNEMENDGIYVSSSITGFLLECLTWNVPNRYFNNEIINDDACAFLAYFYNQTISDSTCAERGEVSELKYLFRSNPQ